MNEGSPLICLIDDDNDFRKALCLILKEEGFEVLPFSSPIIFLEWFSHHAEICSMIVSDINLPGMSGFDMCRALRKDFPEQRVPIIFMTGNNLPDEKADGLEAGGDDFIQKPAKIRDLTAKIHSLLAIREYEDKKVQRFTQFLSPNVADILKNGTHENLLRPHRGHVTVMFVDLRGFTAFAESKEPEEVLAVLNQYYEIVGKAALRWGGTIGNMAGDGIMIFFNAPGRVSNHQAISVRVAVEVRDQLGLQRQSWQRHGYDIDFGVGLAEGYATIGAIGFDRYWQYSVIGPVANFASRMCHLARNGQILVSHRFLARMGMRSCQVEFVGPTSLKGFQKAVAVHNVVAFLNSQVAA